MLSSIIDRITRRKKESEANYTVDLRGVIIALANSELGVKPPRPLDEEFAADVIDSSGLSMADVQATVALFKKRTADAKLAADENKLRDAAARLEQEAIAFDHAECERHRAALQKLAAMQEAARSASDRHFDALRARSDLIAGADTTQREKDLIAQQKKLCEKFDEVKATLNPHASPVAGGAAYMARDNPSAMAREAREKLADTRLTPEQKAKWSATLAAAERAVAERSKELAAIEKQMATINAELTKLTGEKMLPESFRIVRAKPSVDEQMRQRATQLMIG